MIQLTDWFSVKSGKASQTPWSEHTSGLSHQDLRRFDRKLPAYRGAGICRGLAILGLASLCAKSQLAWYTSLAMRSTFP